MFQQGIALIKLGVPYECVFGEKKLWDRVWREAALIVFKELRNPEDDLDE